MQNVFWQVIAAWGAITPLLMMTYLVRMGIGNHRVAKRLSREDGIVIPSARRRFLIFLVAMWLLSLACAIFSLWCIFW
jgi:hypothetical protein